MVRTPKKYIGRLAWLLNLVLVSSFFATQTLAAELMSERSGNYNKAGGLHRFRLFLGQIRTNYSDTGYDEVKDKYTSQEDVGLSGLSLAAGATWRQYEIEVENRNLKPNDLAYWESTVSNRVTIGRYMATVRFISPVVGYTILSQTGDRTADGAPPVFLHKATSLILGAHMAWAPLKFFNTSPIVLGKYHYLTTGEAKTNYGYDYNAGGGWVYKAGSWQFGLTYSVTASRYLASIPSETVDGAILRLASTTKGRMIGLMIQY